MNRGVLIRRGGGRLVGNCIKVVGKFIFQTQIVLFTGIYPSFLLGRKFVLRFGGRGSSGGLCFTPQGGQARNNVPLVFGKCKDKKDVFRMTSSGALASVAFRGFYIRLSAGGLVMYKGARGSAKFKFRGGKIKVKSGRRGGRYMYVQSQGGASASMGMKIVAKSRRSKSFMKFSCMSKYM